VLQVELDRMAFGRGLLRGDFAVLEHGVDDQVAALEGTVGMRDGRVYWGALGSPAKQRGFVEVELLPGC